MDVGLNKRRNANGHAASIGIEVHVVDAASNPVSDSLALVRLTDVVAKSSFTVGCTERSTSDGVDGRSSVFVRDELGETSELGDIVSQQSTPN